MSRDTILLVEDNPDEAELARRGFRRLNSDYYLEVVADGEEALEYLFSDGRYARRPVERNPALIILDIDLPRINGFEVLKKIRSDASYASTPVVMMSTSDERSDILKGYQLGVNSYLRKPVDFDSFADMLQEVSHYWLNTNIRSS